jgi:hypothetical protein
MKRLFLSPVLAALAVVCFVGSVFAADGATPANTTVNVGWFASFLSEYVLPAAGTIVGAGIAYLANMLKTKWGLDIDAKQRDALQTAVTNAAGLLVVRGVSSLDGKTIDVGNPLFAAAIKYVQDAVPGALKHFGLGPEDVAHKIAAKLPMFAQAVPATGEVRATAPTDAPVVAVAAQ